MAICDFGYLRISKNKDQYFGIPEYTPPETIRDRQYEYYSDYWQFGVLLYELAYGHPPFIDYDQNLTFDYILNCQVEFPVAVDVESNFKDLIQKVVYAGYIAPPKGNELETRI